MKWIGLAWLAIGVAVLAISMHWIFAPRVLLCISGSVAEDTGVISLIRRGGDLAPCNKKPGTEPGQGGG